MTAVAAMAYSIEEIPNVHLTDKTQYVSNPDGVLRQATIDSLNRSIAHIWQSSSAEVVAVVVNSIDGNDIDDYATALFRHWGIGKKDNNNGVLVLVSTEERKAVIRNGYGAEGILPDIICGRIIRDNMVPHFREGDYDGGMLSAVARIDSLLTTPGAVAELKSKYENDEKQENYNAFYGYMSLAGSAAAILLLYVLFLAFTPSIKSRFDRYNRLNKIKLLYICATFFTLGMALPALIVLLATMHYCRNRRRICPNCHSKMHKLQEDEDNKYLTPAQDLEEQLESIDYDCGSATRAAKLTCTHSPTSAPYTANVSNATPAHRILKATAFSHNQTPPAAATACAHTFAATAERNRKSTTKSPRLLHLW